MDTREAYNQWAAQYDINENRTRDLEGIALRESLSNISFGNCLEIGCGTGKNTAWLIEKATHITCVDFSEEMLSRARLKIRTNQVEFIQADIRTAWTFNKRLFDLVIFSLVLEHIGDLDHVFREAAMALSEGGYVYIGELHPFKQYMGTKARFDTGNGMEMPECFVHHISDFIQAAKKFGLELADLDEYFDDNDRSGIPRLLKIIFQKHSG